MRLIAIASLFLVAACAGASPGNPQGNAGLTEVRLEYNDQGQLAGVHWIDGKEKQSVRLKADVQAGTIDYSATDVAAFPAFESRAEVERYVASRWPEISPDIRGSIADILTFFAGL